MPPYPEHPNRRAYDNDMVEFMATMRECTATMKLNIEHLQRMMDDHHSTLYGNGKEGIKTEVDRLKQLEKGRKWLWRTAITALLGLVGERLLQFIHFGQGK